MTVWGSDPSGDPSLQPSSPKHILLLQTEERMGARTPGLLPAMHLLEDPLHVPGLQLCIPGGHLQPGTWAKGYGLPAEAGPCSPTCAHGKKGEGPADPTSDREQPAVLGAKPGAHCTLILLQPFKELSLSTAQRGLLPL